MKQLLLLALSAIVIVACNTEQNKYGLGGRNACQFVKEQVPELREEIEKIEVIEEDSIICDIGLVRGMQRLNQVESLYYQNRVTRKDLEFVADSLNLELTFVENCWKSGVPKTYGNKFDGQWRKVYTIRVTMKSGVTKEPRVLMEQNGITPRMLESDFEKWLQNYASDLMGVYRLLIYGIK